MQGGKQLSSVEFSCAWCEELIVRRKRKILLLEFLHIAINTDILYSLAR
jgi:hypothetical protein